MSETFSIGLTKFKPHEGPSPADAGGMDKLKMLVTLTEARRALRAALPIVHLREYEIAFDVMTAITAIDRIVPKEDA